MDMTPRHIRYEEELFQVKQKLFDIQNMHIDEFLRKYDK